MDGINHQKLEVCSIGIIVNGMNFVPVTTRMGTPLMPTIKRHCKHFQFLFTERLVQGSKPFSESGSEVGLAVYTV
jgi:hypothetical protein